MKTRPLALAALVVVVGACASGAVGRPIPRERVNVITRGVTTTAQVRELFGDPDTRAVASDGSEAWGYSFNSENAGGRVAQAICPAILFARYLLLPLGGFCNPIRTEQELNLAFNTEQVVESFKYANREVSLADEIYRQRHPRGDPFPRDPVPVIYTGSTVASQTR